MHRRRLFVTLVVAGSVTLAACGSSNKTGGATSNSTTGATATAGSTAPAVVSKVPGTGVTATTVKLGVSLVDFDCIKQFVDSIRVNQQQVYQAYIDDVNAHGGIDGRKIVPDFKTFCPIGAAGAITLCTQFTDDDKVFAVIGNFTDSSEDGSSQTCIAKKHKTVLITFGLTQAIMSLSPPGMIVYPGATPERTDAVLLDLVKKQGTLTGKKVAVLAQTSSEQGVKKTIVPGLKAMGVPMGTTAYLTVTGSDTTAAQSQLASFIERWKSENVNAVFVTGEDVASQQFMEKLRQALPGVTLLTDITDVKMFGQEEQHAGVKPNPYDGILTAGGITPHDYDQSANWKYCAGIYKTQTGKVAPDAETVVPGPDGKTLDTNGSINDACQTVSLFRDVATKVGKYLNADNWVATVNGYGKITNRGGGPYASLKTGKYDFDDSFLLQSFDPTIAPTGNWKPLTPLENVPG
jgi:ABC-type branched-subunit amino acid transport system substrate-binding protein